MSVSSATPPARPKVTPTIPLDLLLSTVVTATTALQIPADPGSPTRPTGPGPGAYKASCARGGLQSAFCRQLPNGTSAPARCSPAAKACPLATAQRPELARRKQSGALQSPGVDPEAGSCVPFPHQETSLSFVSRLIPLPVQSSQHGQPLREGARAQSPGLIYVAGGLVFGQARQESLGQKLQDGLAFSQGDADPSFWRCIKISYYPTCAPK